jgi:hypothetical protein
VNLAAVRIRPGRDGWELVVTGAAISSGAELKVPLRKANNIALPGEWVEITNYNAEKPSVDREGPGAQNCAMSRTVYELVWGELVGDETNHKVQVELAINEITVDESESPVRRVIAHAVVTTRVNVQDGKYALRYTFEGQLREELVRVESGQVLGSH